MTEAREGVPAAAETAGAYRFQLEAARVVITIAFRTVHGLDDHPAADGADPRGTHSAVRWRGRRSALYVTDPAGDARQMVWNQITVRHRCRTGGREGSSGRAGEHAQREAERCWLGGRIARRSQAR